MMKYIYCIFLGAFLMLGFNHIPDNVMQKFRSRTGTVEMQFCTKSYYNHSTAIVKQACKEHRAIKTEGFNCKTKDGIPATLSLSRNLIPSKTIKLTASASAILTLSSLVPQFPSKKRKGFILDTLFAQPSYRYFIYTLKRILI